MLCLLFALILPSQASDPCAEFCQIVGPDTCLNGSESLHPSTSLPFCYGFYYYDSPSGESSVFYSTVEVSAAPVLVEDLPRILALRSIGKASVASLNSPKWLNDHPFIAGHLWEYWSEYDGELNTVDALAEIVRSAPEDREFDFEELEVIQGLLLRDSPRSPTKWDWPTVSKFIRIIDHTVKSSRDVNASLFPFMLLSHLGISQSPNFHIPDNLRFRGRMYCGDTAAMKKASQALNRSIRKATVESPETFADGPFPRLMELVRDLPRYCFTDESLKPLSVSYQARLSAEPTDEVLQVVIRSTATFWEDSHPLLTSNRVNSLKQGLFRVKYENEPHMGAHIAMQYWFTGVANVIKSNRLITPSPQPIGADRSLFKKVGRFLGLVIATQTPVGIPLPMGLLRDMLRGVPDLTRDETNWDVLAEAFREIVPIGDLRWMNMDTEDLRLILFGEPEVNISTLRQSMHFHAAKLIEKESFTVLLDALEASSKKHRRLFLWRLTGSTQVPAGGFFYRPIVIYAMPKKGDRFGPLSWFSSILVPDTRNFMKMIRFIDHVITTNN